MKRNTLAAVAALLVVLPWLHTVRADAPHYTIQNLGAYNGEVPSISGINAAAQVVGNVPDFDSLAVRYTPGTGWQSLPGLNTNFSVATGINGSGDVVGYYFNALGQVRAYLYRDGVGVEEIAPAGAGTRTLGFGVNDGHDLVGTTRATTTLPMVALFGQPAQALPTLGGTTGTACGINVNRQIAGASKSASGVQHAMRLDPGAAAPIDIQSLDGPAFSVSACAIDASGHVGGAMARANGSRHAFRYTDGVGVVDLDTFNSTESNVESIAAGVSAGWYTLPDNTTHAFAHRDADGSFDLNTRMDAASGWVLTTARAINESGMIAGEGTFNGLPAVYVATPQAADTTPPVIAPHADETAEATGSYGANVFYTAPATTDNVDGAGTAACTPVSGSTFAIGTTPVTCTATDAAGNAAAPTTFNVTVKDTTAPVIAAHADETSEATSASGASVAYSAPVTTDAVDGVRAATCAPASGSTFALGTTTVTCTATDAAGNVATATTFNVVVKDTTAPVIAAHADVAAEATSSRGASVTYSAPTTTDAVDGTGTAKCTPASGSTFALGTTTVSCTASDAAGNAAAATTFNVVVKDTTAPVIAPHADVTASATGPSGATVTYTAPATSDAVDGVGSATCAPASGSTFPLGATLVSCTAVDAAGNAATPTAFRVVVSDTTAPVITALSATPAAIWPPNGKLVPVSIQVSAIDDVDPSPVCAITAVTGGPASDIVITGAFSASVRATRDDDTVRTYLFSVSCSDKAGNTSAAAVSVSVSKDGLTKVYRYDPRSGRLVGGLAYRYGQLRR